MTYSEPVTVDSRSEFESLVDENDVVVTDFHAEWCGSCDQLDPVMDDISEEYDVVVAKVDIEDHQDIANKYHVRSLPTVVVESPKDKESFRGTVSKDTITAELDAVA